MTMEQHQLWVRLPPWYAEDRFLVSIAQGPHLLYSSYRPEEEPIAVFSGHSTTTFYVKACFSGDGTHILSGSGDKRAHIYEVRPNCLSILHPKNANALVVLGLKTGTE